MKLLRSQSRFTKLAAIGAAAVLALSACGGTTAGTEDGGSGDGGGEIQFWDTQATPARTAVLKDIIASFEAENPSIKVKYVGLPSSSYQQKVDTAIATGATPDVITSSITDTANMVAQNAMEALDERFDAGSWADKISKSMVETARSVVPDHKLYFAPASGLANTLWVRPELFKADGVEIPKTWDDFFAAAKTLTHAEKNQFGYIFRGGAGMFPQLLDVMYGQSGISSFIDENGKSTLNDPLNVKALERYVTLYGNESASSDLTADYTKMIAQFASGAGAMMNHNIGSYQDHVKAFGADNILGLQPFPSDNGKVTVSGATVLGPGIFKASKNKDAAWKFTEYFLSAEGNALWAKGLGYIPANTEVAQQAWIQDAQPLKLAASTLDDPNTQVLHEPFYLPEYNSIAKTKLEPEWQKVLQGNETAQGFLDKAAGMYTDAQAAYDKRTKK